MSVDASDENAQTLTIYTIGHSNHTMERFLALLKQHEIQILADVRSSPYSRYATQFNRPDLEYAVERAGVQYLFLGDSLGGRPVGDEFYDAASHVLYGKVAEADFFRKGLERLTDEAALSRVAILCAEEDPTGCHRRLLIGRVLAGEGVTVRHIRGSGALQEAAELDAPAQPATQLSLFDAPEEDEWKSIRPVSPRRPPSSSSKASDEWESGDW